MKLHFLQESNGPTDSYAAIARVDQQRQEPESLRRWREEQRARLEELGAYVCLAGSHPKWLCFIRVYSWWFWRNVTEASNLTAASHCPWWIKPASYPSGFYQHRSNTCTEKLWGGLYTMLSVWMAGSVCLLFGFVFCIAEVFFSLYKSGTAISKTEAHNHNILSNHVIVYITSFPPQTNAL